jgi:hypothetical protein
MERQAHQRLANAATATLASNNFDVKYYRGEWEVDPAVRYIKGKVTVYYVVTSATNSITLDLMNALTVSNVEQRSLSLIKSQSNNTLTINFPGTANAGTLDSVSISYQGVPPDTGLGSFVTSTHNGTAVMWTLSEPYGSRDWWPCKNGLDDKADSIDVLITHPNAYKAASNGLLQSQTPISGSKILTYWKHRYPIASYLVCFAVTNYSVFNNTVQLTNGVLPMQTFCYPESLTSFQNGTANVLNAMQLYDATFGPYPFMNEKYGHVQFGWGGGMEHQTSTFIVNIGESLIAHELGHQWFGDKITCGSWKDVWLNEGFATHLASMYMENKYPSSAISTRKSEINTITLQTGGSVLVDDTTNVDRIFDSRLSYTKGSHLLYMLRWILGDNAFFTALRNYQTDPAIMYGFATTADLKRNLEQTSGLDLTYFFNDWFSGQGYPTYNVQWSNAGSENVWIKMNQTTSHSSVPFFELPVALQFQNGSQTATVVVNNTANGEIFFKNVGFVPTSVVIDPNAWLITRNNTATQITPCGTVSGLASSAVTTTTATLSWSPVSGAGNYSIDYKLASSGTWINVASATTSLSINLSGLTAASLYDWRVKANCKFEGPYTQAQFTTNSTGTCGTVSGLTSSAVASSSATVSWSSVSGANNYDVSYKLASSGTWLNAATATSSLSVNLSGLTASSLYDWRVRANCSGATGAYTQAQFTTSASSACPGTYDVSTNGTTGGAATIPLNTDVKGLINPKGDNDHYKFNITTGGTIAISLTTLPSDYQLALLSSTGVVLQSSVKSGTTSESISTNIMAGSYYAKVYPKNNGQFNANSCYTLKVSTGTAARSSTQESNNKIKMYLHPNPANEILNISLVGYINEKVIEILDLTGKVVITDRTIQNNAALRINTLPGGLYLIKISARDGTLLSKDKFVKE